MIAYEVSFYIGSIYKLLEVYWFASQQLYLSVPQPDLPEFVG